MAVLNVTTPDADGENIPFAAAAAGGDQVPFDRRRIILVRNGSGAGITLTINLYSTIQTVAVPNKTVTIPAGQEWAFVAGQDHVNPSTGNVHLGYSASASVLVAVLQPPS